MVGSYVWSLKNNKVEDPPDPPMTWRRALIYTFIAIYAVASIALAIGVLFT